MDIDYLTGNKRKAPKKKNNMMDIDRILPKLNLKESIPKELKVKRVEVHHYHHNLPDEDNMSSMLKDQRPRKRTGMRLTALEGEMPKDLDGDGIPNAFDPNPMVAQQPRKKLIYEKTLQSIYRSDKD